MKRMVVWSVAVGSVAVAIGLFATKAPHAAPAAKPAAPSSAAEKPAEGQQEGKAGTEEGKESQEGKVAYTFSDDAAMRKFAEQSQQRQAVLVRMSVLRAYWTEEQAKLMEMDKRFAADYGLDVTKSYMLDTRRRVLIEQNAPAAAAPASSASLLSEPPPAQGP